MSERQIIAIGLLTQRDLNLLGPSFEHVWPIDDAPCFGGLLQAIDEAERGLRRDRDGAANKTSAQDQGSQTSKAFSPPPLIP